MAGAAKAPTGPVHVAAAPPITLPHLPPDRRWNGAAAYPGLGRRRSGSGGPDRPRRSRRGCTLRAASHFRRRSGDSGGRRGIRRGRVLRRRSCAGNLRSPGGGRRRRPRRRSARRTHHPNGCAVRAAVVAFGAAGSFGAEVARATSALRRPPRRPHGGRDGSWRSSASCTNRPSSCPVVICGSTWDNSPLSCSNPRWQSSSTTAFEFPPPRAQRAHPVGRRCQVRIDLGQHFLHLPGAARTSRCRPPWRPP